VVVSAGATSILSEWTLYQSLTKEYRSKGMTIAKSVADSSAEVLFNRGLTTVQAIIDQFDEIEGVAYVFVADAHGDVVAHTFVPAVPKEVLAFIGESRTRPSNHNVVTTPPHLPARGGLVHLYAP